MGTNIAELKDMTSALGKWIFFLNEDIKWSCGQADILFAPHRKHHNINNKDGKICKKWMLVDDAGLGDLCLTLIFPCVSYRELVRLKICFFTGG